MAVVVAVDEARRRQKPAAVDHPGPVGHEAGRGADRRDRVARDLDVVARPGTVEPRRAVRQRREHVRDEEIGHRCLVSDGAAARFRGRRRVGSHCA